MLCYDAEDVRVRAFAELANCIELVAHTRSIPVNRNRIATSFMWFGGDIAQYVFGKHRQCGLPWLVLRLHA